MPCDPTRHSSLFWKDCTPWKGLMLMWEGSTLEKFMEISLPGKGPIQEQGKSMSSPPPEEERSSETMCNELTVNPIPHPTASLEGRRESKLGVK